MAAFKMPKLEAVVTHMNSESKKLKYFVGSQKIGYADIRLPPYDPLVCKFLSELSNALLSDLEAKSYPDIITFAFWCRKSNIEMLKSNFHSSELRLGLGLVLHITPSNIPINFAFSYAFSLLAGNSNVVRVPSRNTPQTEIISRVINSIISNSDYEKISEMTLFIQYDHSNEITAAYSKRCAARIIWGGDRAVNEIRAIPSAPRSIDISFSDRYSICVVSCNAILDLTQAELRRLTNGFYDDVYLMDQNACSSPHLIVWLGDVSVLKTAQYKFWNDLAKVVSEKYDLKPINAIDKYTLLCEQAIKLDEVLSFDKVENFIYRVQLDNIPKNLDSYRGKFGFFYEYGTNNLHEMAEVITNKFQTLTYYGVSKSLLADFVIKNQLPGIDRIVPIGSALSIGTIWDGYDLVRTLSRVIDIK